MGVFAPAGTSALDAANYIRTLAARDGVALETLVLQKMLYYGQCWALLESSRLFDDAVEAWKHGPVVRNVWVAFSGCTHVPPHQDALMYELTAAQREILDSVWAVLRMKSGLELSAMTHASGTAWSKARAGLPTTASSDRKLELEDMAADAEVLRQESERKLSAVWDDLKRLERPA